MLSGIGHKSHLDDLKIPVVADLPVGDNLQDHPATILRVLIDEPLSINGDKLTSTWTQWMYSLFKTGYKTTPGTLEFSEYVRTQNDLEYGNPDVQLEMLVSIPDAEFIQRLINLDPKISEEIKWEATEGFLIVPGCQRPQSSGTVRLRSANSFEYPVIQPNYLHATEDMMAVYRGIRLFQKLLKTDALKKIGARLHSTPMPLCTQHHYDSDEYWQCCVRSLTFGTFHQCCTCKMGALNDPTTVVNPHLRVKGIDGLRVADASIMPFIVSANTNAASIMIGE
ncbi:glucose dehydrogenase [FAD, quinone]-like [Gigantopelta aegis]|uniref:glucose dehydrogenase [FAD, quinone]-like n=1 Tax=Gigantopelta aegis TaxID=1735272 RepID=UPI001B8896C7|nr:glucose dehydrogenase [FAD, quinone]-like [Gigantopelta aegis]